MSNEDYLPIVGSPEFIDHIAEKASRLPGVKRTARVDDGSLRVYFDEAQTDYETVLSALMESHDTQSS